MWLRVRKTCLIQNEIQKGFNRIIVIADAAHSFGAKFKMLQSEILQILHVFISCC